MINKKQYAMGCYFFIFSLEAGTCIQPHEENQSMSDKGQRLAAASNHVRMPTPRVLPFVLQNYVCCFSIEDHLVVQQEREL